MKWLAVAISNDLIVASNGHIEQICSALEWIAYVADVNRNRNIGLNSVGEHYSDSDVADDAAAAVSKLLQAADGTAEGHKLTRKVEFQSRFGRNNSRYDDGETIVSFYQGILGIEIDGHVQRRF